MRHHHNWLHSPFRIVVMAIAMGAVVFYELARAYYRPFVYSHGINDLHVADTLGNSLGTVATVFAFASVFGCDFSRGLFVLRSAVISVIVYELLHPLLGKQIDPYDIVATFVAGAVSEMVFRWLGRRLSKDP